MTRLFIACLIIISLGATFIVSTQPSSQSDVPILYWVTDPNPARYEQIELFKEWLIENGHVTEAGKPVMEIRLETGGIDNKTIIHGVSGVAGDIIDLYNVVQKYQQLGILENITEMATEHDFGLDKTYEALEPMLVIDGGQYAFPCNVTVHACWANMDTFEQYGIEKLPESWSIEEFERIGKAFVKQANEGKQRQDVFFMNNPTDDMFPYWMTVMVRSQGASLYNETMTRSMMHSPAFIRALETNRKWIEDDHLFPSSAEAASFSSAGGYGGAKMSLFLDGHYGMINIGRWVLVRMREMDNPPRVSVSRYPYFEYPNAIILGRAAAIYKGSKHKDLAALFLAYLASEKYNKQIVASADAMPPNPKYAKSEAYRKPPEHRNEWGAHEVPYEAAMSIAIAESKSPYINHSFLNKEIKDAFDKVQSKLASPEEAARQAALAVDTEIVRNLRDRLTLKERYEEALVLQEKIDKLKEEGKKIPADWVINPFLKHHYRKIGLLQ